MERRDFIKTSISSTLGFGAGLTILSGAASAQGTTANNKINLALIGCGGRGTSLLHGFDYPNNSRITGFQEMDDVNVVYCCDVRKERGEKAAGKANAKYVSEMRTVLDDKSVDAVVCALPDHWHALGAILAIQAGKDVYTEKPVSQSGWEGQKMVEAARKYKRIVQHGTQNRSAAYNIEAKKYIEDGKLGTIHLCRVFNQKREMNSFKIKTGEPLPEGINWSAWLGPAADRPYSSTILNSNWHELWDFSSGDVLNDGVHQIDLARWLVGKEIPKSAYAVGGRFTDPNSDAQTPDTLIASYEFDDLTFTVEETLYSNYILKIDGTVRQSDMFPYWMQCATRIELYGTKGLMMVGRHGGGWQVFDRPKDRQPVVKAQAFGRFPDVEHKRNFLDCIKSRELPNADIEKGHRSTSLVHYSTISYRLGGMKLDIDEKTGVPKNPQAAQYWKRDYRSPYVIPDEV
ncbi:MAG: Gfo/Idh/MocA family oxidoreductase [Planctomycetaceae bacterium]|jgi:predicted dehydrogenase|nr:Gfo/Idh/MocA family oxidoreductase [Planctomycetaceae bacterium]